MARLSAASFCFPSIRTGTLVIRADQNLEKLRIDAHLTLSTALSPPSADLCPRASTPRPRNDVGRRRAGRRSSLRSAPRVTARRYGIVPAGAERMAARDAPHRKPPAPQQAVLAQRLDRVFRARRQMTAAGRDDQATARADRAAPRRPRCCAGRIIRGSPPTGRTSPETPCGRIDPNRIRNVSSTTTANLPARTIPHAGAEPGGNPWASTGHRCGTPRPPMQPRQESHILRG